VPQAAAWLPKRAPQKNSDLPGVVAASQLVSYGQHNVIHFFWLVVLTILKNMKVNGWWILPYIVEKNV